ncbi:hypothetical protein [Paenibacillus nasutitermitis]|uniref:Uncharacterized protein n=1 Tax=Paenibacillus nasutitermitis TaxID=1652958 RepID=A0A916YU25_9BACL|nr:hypothetical protein [Paenibacillus nasutitermitis]GGD60021.1 hypothetical protein GCM10010911_17370 [Paenibacillus nasutitermitis]
MENNDPMVNATALDRIVNYEDYISGMNNDELMVIINRLEIFEEAAAALTELSIRDTEAAVPSCSKILAENLGDEFLQAVAFNLLYEGDAELAMEIIRKQVSHAPAALLGAMMDNLSTDSLQPVGQSLPSSFLRSVVDRYQALNDTDQERILENYEWFQESYKDKLM